MEEFPLLPLQELVLFPHPLMSVFITYKTGMTAIDEALKRDLRLFAACLKMRDAAETYAEGSVVRIVQHVKMPDNTFRVMLQGEYRGTIASSTRRNDLALVKIEPIGSAADGGAANTETLALMQAVQKSFAQYAENTKKISANTIVAAEKTESLERLADIACHALQIKAERKIELLGVAEPVKRLEAVLAALELENEIFAIQKNISGKVKNRMEKNQREYILNEQIKEINRELGKDEKEDEFAEIERALESKGLKEEGALKARKELARLRRLQPLSPDAGVLRGYLEWIIDLPWYERTIDSGDLAEAQRILHEDHFAMHEAKKRILEFIAVRKLLSLENKGADNGEEAPVKGPILCFAGPPGTGKTSLAKSFARALGRRFVRISLGGVRDEAEIRGHRKTYVGALPGKIIQGMRKAGTINPVFLLDEIDKLAHDVRGDPASALLEVLDPEQNSAFTDHYLELPYDLSQSLFITTANSLHTIPYPLLDRMEVIEIPGYGESEKRAIARGFLVPKALRENGLGSALVAFSDAAVLAVIRHWTMESGVRGLERELARCVRRIAQDALNGGYGQDGAKPLASFTRAVEGADIEKLLGKRKYKRGLFRREPRAGVAYGLAWTEAGGAILLIESIFAAGSGEPVITGNLGNVMQESVRIALSYVRSVQERWGVPAAPEGALHIHVPEGAVPKDGPSAGIAIAVSLMSAMRGLPPKAGAAMTGELTLTGRVLPIGGLKEKLLAAIRENMDRVILPQANEEDWAELSDDMKGALAVDFVETADQVFTLLFPPPAPPAQPKAVSGASRGERVCTFSHNPEDGPQRNSMAEGRCTRRTGWGFG
ncbi:MAG: endopeptidase La, partial [Spirochaetaceae bacterium]|nr:endopeptidase La [Spirochaetaceae bacterium]